MPASIFLDMNDDLQRIFAHDGSVTWFRPGGPAGGHPLTAWFAETSMVEERGGIEVPVSVPRLTTFIGDILAIDPSRTSWDHDELFRNTGDRFEIDGRSYRVESCTADGHGKCIVDLIAT